MNKIIVVLGPTASGKTKLAVNLAFNFNAEIISADSRQVYKNMNIGTGKDLSDYEVNGIHVNYHLIDIKEPGYKYNLYEYQQDFLTVFNGLQQQGKLAILCGGSGLYIDAVLNNYNLLSVKPDEDLRKKLEKKSLEELTDIISHYKTLHNITDIDTKKRAIRAIEIAQYYKNNPDKNMSLPNMRRLLLGVKYERERERANIKNRLDSRLQEGMIEEVETLLNKLSSSEDIIYYGLEYKFIALYLIGEISYDEMVDKLYIAICQYAKRQNTWFRKMEREGNKIEWIEGEKSMSDKMVIAEQLINEFLNE